MVNAYLHYVPNDRFACSIVFVSEKALCVKEESCDAAEADEQYGVKAEK